LQISYSVNNIDLERENGLEKKVLAIEKPESIANAKQPRKTSVIPSIYNFPEFKKWLLNKLTELEKFDIAERISKNPRS
jgi:hypothetical protein